MKRLYVLIICLAIHASLCAQDFSGRQTAIKSIPAPEEPLKAGESLQYSIEWLGIPVGNIALKIQGMDNIAGNDCYHVVADTQPNSFFRRFYNVEYTVHTYIDKLSFLTRRFEKTRRSGNKVFHERIDFDRKENKVAYKSDGSAPNLAISNQRPKLELQIKPSAGISSDTQDLFSSLYYLRGKEIRAGNSYALNIYYSQRNWRINFDVGKPFLREMRKQGSCQVFQVSLTSDLSSFILGNPDIMVYFTADSRRIPVEFKLGTGIGSFRGIIKNLPK